MKQLMFCLLLLPTFQTAFGQVTGKLSDQNNQAIPFATVMLLNSSDSAIVKSSLTDNKGAFQIADISDGKYIVRISMVGYQTYKSKSFELNTDNPHKDYGVIVLNNASKQLGEVVIRSGNSMGGW